MQLNLEQQDGNRESEKGAYSLWCTSFGARRYKTRTDEIRQLGATDEDDAPRDPSITKPTEMGVHMRAFIRIKLQLISQIVCNGDAFYTF